MGSLTEKDTLSLSQVHLWWLNFKLKKKKPRWEEIGRKCWPQSPCRLERTMYSVVSCFYQFNNSVGISKKLEANVLWLQWLFLVFTGGKWERRCVDLISIWFFFLNPFACREEQLVVGNLALGSYQVKERDTQQLLQRQLLWGWAEESPGKQLGSPRSSK